MEIWSIAHSISLRVPLALYLVSFCCVILSVRMMLRQSSKRLGKNSTKREWLLPIFRESWVYLAGLNMRRLGMTISTIVLSYSIGYLHGRIQHYDRIVPYYDVPVTKVYSPYSYQLLIGESTYDIDICNDGPSPNWQAGETLTHVTWEVMSGCHRVYGPDVSFKEDRDETTGKLIFKEIANVAR